MSGSIKKFDKLCRDKIPELITNDGMAYVIEELSDTGEDRTRLLGYVRKKVLEEAQELAEAKTTEEVLAEAADLYDVILKLLAIYDRNDADLLNASIKKQMNAGKFEKNYILKEIKHRPPKRKNNDAN